MSAAPGWDAWDATDGGRRGPAVELDTVRDDVHSALVPPGAQHRRVTAALANGQLDAAEQLLAAVEHDPSPFTATGADTSPDLGRAWADTLRAELLVRRLRVAGFTLVGEPVSADTSAEPALDLHAGVTELIDRDGDPSSDDGEDADPRAESASRAALAIALVRSAKAAFDATDDDVQRAAGLARHARIELISRRIDAAMDEAVEAASLLDPALAPDPLLIDTLAALAGVLADLELMPLALDYQRRAYEGAVALAGELPDADDGGRRLVATTAIRLGELCAELGEALLDDGVAESAHSHFTEARALAELALSLLPPGAAAPAQVVLGWALVGLGSHTAALEPLRAATRAAAEDRALLASAHLAHGRALRRQGDGAAADAPLVAALDIASEQGLTRCRRAALRELCTLHAERDDAERALPYLQAYLADELDRVDERRTRWVELFGRRKSLLETERAAGQLRRQAYEDPLTHLPNRRYAEARLDGLLSTGAAPALAVVDVDRFKEVNDAIGHPGGDAVLRIVGELLIAGVRDTDEVCRWAGDEFVILLPDTTAEQGERALERIRRGIAAYDWAELGLDFPVTISAGIASAARGDDRRTLFAAADGVLYDAKRSGRDRVVRLSAVTQSRAGESPVDVLFGLPDAADEPSTAGAEGEARTQLPVMPSPPLTEEPTLPEDRGFGPLLADPAPVRPPHVPLGTGGPLDPPLGPVSHPGPALPPPVEEVTAEVPLRAAAAEVRGVGAEVPVRGAGAEVPVRGVGAEPEVIRATGRTTEQVLALVREARREHPHRPALVLGAAPETLVALAGEHDAYTTMDAQAMAAAVGPLPDVRGRVTVLCAGAADAPVAAEAAFVAQVSGTEVVRVDDVGGSRMRTLVADPSLLTEVDCLLVVAGLDASLATLVGALTDVPVVAVPTSAGQPAGLGGLGALLTMLNSSAPGVAVSGIDSGYSAGVLAARIARRSA